MGDAGNHDHRTTMQVCGGGLKHHWHWRDNWGRGTLDIKSLKLRKILSHDIVSIRTGKEERGLAFNIPGLKHNSAPPSPPPSHPAHPVHGGGAGSGARGGVLLGRGAGGMVAS